MKMQEKSNQYTGWVNCLIKIAAIILIVSGCVFAGRYISAFQDKKADILEETAMMISFMQTRLRYDCLPLLSLLRATQESGKAGSLKFVSICIEKSENGMPFPSAWRESVENDAELRRYIRNASAYLIRFGNDLGTTDLEGQLSCCEYYETVFRNELSDRKEHNKKYSKLYPTLGAMLGIWAAILII